MAAASSNGTASKMGIKYPELEEKALQFILDCCESSISKYTKFLELITNIYACSSHACSILMSTEHGLQILRRRLRDMRSGELRALTLFNGFRKIFKQ
ncbi:hypothetical protein BHE74_00004303 [Ensete ventricosum]|nr:hypothetical protein GW17_00004494 [Ensete ventricosum]RWW86902.1 hypothetical protein BHE74_00004303 [Ensete ventricosum]